VIGVTTIGDPGYGFDLSFWRRIIGKMQETWWASISTCKERQMKTEHKYYVVAWWIVRVGWDRL
jgi:hypothetical protein